ncbi:hypothetical protein NQZ68_001218 [Dissostichus eleginoides]|nr:hypothetical protein NQZ68_001218 [Dissostichus eleginoides]
MELAGTWSKAAILLVGADAEPRPRMRHGHRRTRGLLRGQVPVRHTEGKNTNTADNSENPILPFYMSLDCERKPEHSEETGAGME